MKIPSVPRFRHRTLHYLLPASLLLTFASLASADVVLTDGSGFQAPTATSNSFVGLVQDTGILNISNGALTGQVEELVVTDDGSGGYCVGCLDFLVIARDTADSITSINLGSFANAQTAIGFIAGGVDPDLVYRTHGIIHFLFSGGVSSGQETDFLVIKTDSTTYASGNLTISDNGSENFAGFGTVPEPNPAYVLFLLVPGVLGVLSRRKKSTEV